MKILCFVLLIFLGIGSTVGQNTYPASGSGRQPPTTPCSKPTLTSDWAASSLSSTVHCGTGTTICINGAQIHLIPDVVGSNNITSLVGSGSAPFYQTSILNNQPVVQWTSTSIAYFGLGTSIPAANTTSSFFMTLAPTTGAVRKLVTGPTGALFWEISATGHQLVFAGTGATITGTTAFTSGSFVTIAFTYSSGVINLYTCSGGVCTSDGTGNTGTPTAAITEFGQGGGTGTYLGYIAEIGYLNGASITGFATYSQCKYGI
jgi:hypothetical protein